MGPFKTFPYLSNSALYHVHVESIKDVGRQQQSPYPSLITGTESDRQ